MSIPIVDLEAVNINRPAADIDNATMVQVGKKMVDALTEVGFLQVVNHGISQDIIEESSKKSSAFFDCPLESKLKHLRKKGEFMGYHPVPEVAAKIEETKVERFSDRHLPDAKELIHYSEYAEGDKIPDQCVPGFKETMDKLLDQEHNLHRRVMLLLGHGLQLSEPHTFVQALQRLGTAENETCIRLAYYPPLETILENQVRCGIHTDFGTLTFVFQNSVPGLKVRSRAGEYIPVKPVDGAILVNVGDLLQLWTGNILRSAHHKVDIDEATRKEGRLSLIYFGISDADCPISAVVGEQDRKRPDGVTARDFLRQRYVDIYEKNRGLMEDDE